MMTTVVPGIKCRVARTGVGTVAKNAAAIEPRANTTIVKTADRTGTMRIPPKLAGETGPGLVVVMLNSMMPTTIGEAFVEAAHRADGSPITMAIRTLAADGNLAVQKTAEVATETTRTTVEVAIAKVVPRVAGSATRKDTPRLRDAAGKLVVAEMAEAGIARTMTIGAEAALVAAADTAAGSVTPKAMQKPRVADGEGETRSLPKNAQPWPRFSAAF